MPKAKTIATNIPVEEINIPHLWEGYQQTIDPPFQIQKSNWRIYNLCKQYYKTN